MWEGDDSTVDAGSIERTCYNPLFLISYEIHPFYLLNVVKNNFGGENHG